MPWPIRYHEQMPDVPQPGDMWLAPEMIDGEDADYYRTHLLSEEYFRERSHLRPPLVVRLPNGADFCVDRRPSSGGSGWDVSGEAPNITVSPSINDAAFSREYGYHGFLTSGVLTDDAEGRTFPN